jgi:hypothetical protein
MFVRFAAVVKSFNVVKASNVGVKNDIYLARAAGRLFSSNDLAIFQDAECPRQRPETRGRQ